MTSDSKTSIVSKKQAHRSLFCPPQRIDRLPRVSLIDRENVSISNRDGQSTGRRAAATTVARQRSQSSQWCSPRGQCVSVRRCSFCVSVCLSVSLSLCRRLSVLVFCWPHVLANSPSIVACEMMLLSLLQPVKCLYTGFARYTEEDCCYYIAP